MAADGSNNSGIDALLPVEIARKAEHIGAQKVRVDTITLLKDRDQALLENQIKLYVRARWYEEGDHGGTFVTGSYLGDEILTRMSAPNAGMKTWRRPWPGRRSISCSSPIAWKTVM